MGAAVVKPLVLVGLRASGKSTLGLALARRTGLAFVDMDVFFTPSVEGFVQKYGWPAFREEESRLMAQHIQGPCVVATGGGVVLKPENREFLQKNCHVVYVHVLPEILVKRLAQEAQAGNRPPLPSAKKDALAECTRQYKERDTLYRSIACFILDNTGKNETDALEILAEWAESLLPQVTQKNLTQTITDTKNTWLADPYSAPAPFPQSLTPCLAEGEREGGGFSPFSSTLLFTGEATSALDAAFYLAGRGELAEWSGCLVASQRAGRGQMRRDWASPVGNMYCALRLPCEGVFATEYAAPAFGALMACAFRRMGVAVKVKWPNDILVDIGGILHKAGGILLEEKGGILLVGFGLNLIWAPPVSALREDYAFPAGTFTTMLGAKQAQLGALPPTPAGWGKLLVRTLFFLYHTQSKEEERWWAGLLAPYLLSPIPEFLAK